MSELFEEKVSDLVADLTRQRDEALEKYFVMRDLSNNATELAEKYKRERDEAREEAERFRLEANAMMMQRDEARDAAQRLRVENNHNWQAMEMAEQAFRERNLAINFLLDIRRNEGRVILSQLDEVLAKLDAL